MKKFNIPEKYRSSIIGKVKEYRKLADPRKQDFSPTILDLDSVRFVIARHFGFCFGVENAIEISYKAIEENPDKRIYLLSQMIHNPEVNRDLREKGIDFIMDTEGNQLTPWEDITQEDIVIIPAFGTTIETEKKLESIGIEVQRYNTTCPFVERVWKKSKKLGDNNYSIIIHGKHKHEETRATFSHSNQNAPSLIIKDLEEAKVLGEMILNERSEKEFHERFKSRMSHNFNFKIDLQKIGVVNQTTMLATETQEIANHLKEVMTKKYGTDNYKGHFADTRDTLCYATTDNQQATYELLKQKVDLAIVVGGYNSSNTSHLVELCETKFPTYFINNDKEIVSKDLIYHFDINSKERKASTNFLPQKTPITIILTSGASCPDTLIDNVLKRVALLVDNSSDITDAIKKLTEKQTL